ncbi:MAG: hypothetical protein ACYC35_09960, partial [Pirellulales bacterium]
VGEKWNFEDLLTNRKKRSRLQEWENGDLLTNRERRARGKWKQRRVVDQQLLGPVIRTRQIGWLLSSADGIYAGQVE